MNELTVSTKLFEYAFQTQIVILTANAHHPDHDKCIDVDANEILTNPIETT